MNSLRKVSVLIISSSGEKEKLVSVSSLEICSSGIRNYRSGKEVFWSLSVSEHVQKRGARKRGSTSASSRL